VNDYPDESGVAVAMDLHVTERGSGERLVVLIHGVLDRGRSFDQVIGLLEPDCRMLVYDRRGYGSSAGLSEGPVGVPQHVDDLLSILDGRPAVLAGHSFGGIIALSAAARAPELIQALAVYECAVAWAPDWDDHVMIGVLGNENAEEAGLRLMLGDRFDSMSSEERDRRRRGARAFLAEERSVRTPAPPFDVASIKVPLIYGRSDTDALDGVVSYLRAEVPTTEVVVLPHADHHAHRTDPEGFAGLVRRALARSSGS
jgi:pimeloyl-ACP methyl ester carboxylesterase